MSRLIFFYPLLQATAPSAQPEQPDQSRLSISERVAVTITGQRRPLLQPARFRAPSTASASVPQPSTSTGEPQASSMPSTSTGEPQESSMQHRPEPLSVTSRTCSASLGSLEQMTASTSAAASYPPRPADRSRTVDCVVSVNTVIFFSIYLYARMFCHTVFPWTY